MKKKLIFLILLLAGIQATSQELSVNFDAGYGFNIATESIIEGYSNRIGEYETEFKSIIYTHGRGLNFNTEIEYFPKKQIGFGLGFGYLKSKKFDVLFNRIDYFSTSVYSARMLRFSPYLKLKHEFGNLAIYTRFGYLLGTFGQITREGSSNTDTGAEGFSKTIYDKGESHGGTAGLGIEFKINDRLNLSSEVKLIVQSYGPKRKRLVERTSDGVNTLNELQPGEIQTNFVDNDIREWNPDGTTDFSKPLTALRIFYPFSSVGINLGVQYKLIKEKKK